MRRPTRTSTPGIDTRREFLRWLALSPLLGAARWVAGATPANPASDWRTREAHPLRDGLITSADDALDVMEFEPVARNNLPPAHFAYMATGVDDDGTIAANRAGFTHWQIRPRRLVDVSHVDTSVELFGQTWNTPILLAPASGQRAFHPEGEVATARAARAKNHLMILSTVATTSVEEVNAA